MSKLVCLSGLNKGDEYALHEGSNLIGRSQECNITLFDKKCSRTHCQIIKRGNHYSIEDLDSHNGTLLNGKDIKGKPRSCKSSDKIRIGKTTMMISLKSVGGVIDQTATDVAAELTQTGYGNLLSNASVDVVRNQQSHHPPKRKSIRQVLKSIFGRS